MKKWQTVVPKEVRAAAGIAIGDTLLWTYDSGRILVEAPRRIANPSRRLFGLVPSSVDAVEKVRDVRKRRLEKIRTEGLH